MNTEKVIFAGKDCSQSRSVPLESESSGLAQDGKVEDCTFDDGMDSLFLEINEPQFDVFDDGMEDLFSKVHDPSANDIFDDGMDEIFSNLDELNQESEQTFSKESFQMKRKNDVVEETIIPVDSTKKQKRSSNIPSFFLSSSQNSQPVVKPSFPGPAGLIDNNKPNPYLYSKGPPTVDAIQDSPVIKKSIIKPISTLMKPTVYNEHQRRSTTIENESTLMLQQQNKPWLTLMKELNTSLTDPDSILHLMNIEWLKNNVDRFPEKIKVPFLMGVVEHSISKDLTVRNTTRLTDHTGTFVWLDHSFLAAFKDHVVPGTCLVLLNCRIHYEKAKNCICLVVLEKNVCFLATLKETLEPVLVSDAKNHCLLPGNSNDPSRVAKKEVIVMQTAQWTPERIMNDYILLQSSLNKDKSNASKVVAPPGNAKDEQIGNNEDDDEDFINAINEINFDLFDYM